jgi:hypothetical protein
VPEIAWVLTPYLDGVFWRFNTTAVLLPNKYLHKYIERKKVVVVVVVTW